MRLEAESGTSSKDELGGLIGSCSRLVFDMGCRIKDLSKDMLIQLGYRKRRIVVVSNLSGGGPCHERLEQFMLMNRVYERIQSVTRRCLVTCLLVMVGMPWSWLLLVPRPLWP